MFLFKFFWDLACFLIVHILLSTCSFMILKLFSSYFIYVCTHAPSIGELCYVHKGKSGPFNLLVASCFPLSKSASFHYWTEKHDKNHTCSVAHKVWWWLQSSKTPGPPSQVCSHSSTGRIRCRKLSGDNAMCGGQKKGSELRRKGKAFRGSGTCPKLSVKVGAALAERQQNWWQQREGETGVDCWQRDVYLKRMHEWQFSNGPI